MTKQPTSEHNEIDVPIEEDRTFEEKLRELTEAFNREVSKLSLMF